jgi:hypothetical protein
MREVTQAADATIKWPGVIDAVRDGDYVFVRLTTGQAAVIARRSYSGPVPFDDIPRVISEFKQQHIAEPTAAPNGGPREPSGNSGAGGGLPSVS